MLTCCLDGGYLGAQEICRVRFKGLLCVVWGAQEICRVRFKVRKRLFYALFCDPINLALISALRFEKELAVMGAKRSVKFLVSPLMHKL